VINYDSFSSECHTEDLDEDISHESYVRRHIIAEKQEKMRYYQSAIQNSRRKKKQRKSCLLYVTGCLIFVIICRNESSIGKSATGKLSN